MFSDDNYRQFATVREDGPCGVVLHVFGDVDLSTAGDLEDAIDEIAMGGDSLLVDLSRCRYLDSSGLTALLHARALLGTRLTILVNSKSQIRRVMQLVGFDEIFNVVTELHTGVETLRIENETQAALALRESERLFRASDE